MKAKFGLKFGAIDIGSNAVRLLIADIHEYASGLRISKLSLTRVPIRLGESVFKNGIISASKIAKLEKTIQAFQLLMDVYEVEAYRACATSAMREAANRDKLIAHLKSETGVNIEIIDGRTEAQLIFSTFPTQHLPLHNTYLYIDVGGGSTEITLLKGGKRVKSRSFRIGTVRILQDKVSSRDWSALTAFVESIVEGEEDIIAVGTGGNINRIFKMNHLTFGKPLTFKMLKKTYKLLAPLTVEERIEKLRLRKDRADVILPAASIYLTILKTAGIETMQVPKVGLSDGMALYLYKAHKLAEKVNPAF